MKIIITLFLTLCSYAAHAKVEQVFDTKNQRTMPYVDFIKELPNHGFVVMGEFHNDPLIQTAQARVMSHKVMVAGAREKFSFMWEFLNFTDQEKIDVLYGKYTNNQISMDDFFAQTVGTNNKEYAPLFSSTKVWGGEVYGLNLPRDIKQIVVKDGIDAIDPALVPPNFNLLTDDYFARFKAAMGGHAPQDLVKKYYVAQCLVDAVMSYHAVQNHNNLSFIVAGSFHTDFYDGTTLKLKALTAEPVTSLKFINANNLTEQDLAHFLAGHETYGQYADYIIITK
jgi:uncharacterized iron-regulated protein